IDLPVGVPHALHIVCQTVVLPSTGTAQLWVASACRMSPVTRRGHLQNPADGLDPERVSVLVDETLQLFKRRSSSAWAKNALAALRMSLARRNSLFSRSNCLRRSRSLLVNPSRWPASISSRLTHSCRVWGTQPIFGAIDSIAAHSEGYSPRCSCTMRTARSRTSGENFDDLFMALSSQELEPPQNPGRFMLDMPKYFHGEQWEEIRFDIDESAQPDNLGSMLDISLVSDGTVDAVFSSHN